MSDIDILKKMMDKYKDLFNKEGLKHWKEKKKYAWAEIVASLNLAIKYIFVFENE